MKATKDKAVQLDRSTGIIEQSRCDSHCLSSGAVNHSEISSEGGLSCQMRETLLTRKKKEREEGEILPVRRLYVPFCPFLATNRVNRPNEQAGKGDPKSLRAERQGQKSDVSSACSISDQERLNRSSVCVPTCPPICATYSADTPVISLISCIMGQLWRTSWSLDEALGTKKGQKIKLAGRTAATSNLKCRLYGRAEHAEN